MSEHYFSARPRAEHAESSFSVKLRGMEFSFWTDSAVFSRDRVDFGSLLLIDTLEVGPEDTVVDVGCGYGPIGLTVAKLVPGAKVYLVDINERAAALARRNLAANSVENAEVRTGDGLEPVRGITFDHVVTNPPIRAGKTVVYRMVDEASHSLRSGGALWVVVQTKQGAPSMKKKLQAVFGNVEDLQRQAGYHVFRAIKE